MIKMNQMGFTQNGWVPDMPVSKGAEGYHRAVINATWNIDNINWLIEIIKPDIRENDVIVDFGAGTGASAISILNAAKTSINLILVDNSPAWLAKAYQLLHDNPNIYFFIIRDKNGKYEALGNTIGKNTADIVVSANTVHLISELDEAFAGIADALKKKGKFAFQSGSIFRNGRPRDILMIEDTVHRVHDIAANIIKQNDLFKKYREGLNERIKAEEPQRNFIFRPHRSVDIYLDALKKSGFEHDKPIFRKIRVKYSDWLNFLRVRRLQAGIFPEIGGRNPSPDEEKDRDVLITLAAKQLFLELEEKNSLADKKSFTVEWTYIKSTKA